VNECDGVRPDVIIDEGKTSHFPLMRTLGDFTFTPYGALERDVFFR